MDGDAADVVEAEVGLAQGLVDDGKEALEMGAGGDLGDDAAEAGVQVGLRGDDAGQDGRLLREHGGRRLVAGGFNAEEIHRKLSRRHQNAVFSFPNSVWERTPGKLRFPNWNP